MSSKAVSRGCVVVVEDPLQLAAHHPADDALAGVATINELYNVESARAGQIDAARAADAILD